MKLSILAPLYNEAENVPILVSRLIAVLDRLQYHYEIILVNDCSSDDTLPRLQQAAAEFSQVKIINLSRNSGQTAAMMAGINYASGDVIIPIDGDLQNDPEDIPLLLEKINEGYDVVSGWRKDRKDASLRRNFPSRIANKLISWISGVKLHDYGCSLKAYRKEAIKNVRLYGEMHRFIPIYASWQGAKVTEIPVRHHPRLYGKSKYGLNRIVKVILDLLVIKFLERYATKPIYIFGGFGLFCLAFGLLVGLVCIYLKFFAATDFIKTPLPLLSAISFLVGITSILMGLLAEIVSRTYFESQQKNVYIVKNTINTES